MRVELAGKVCVARGKLLRRFGNPEPRRGIVVWLNVQPRRDSSLSRTFNQRQSSPRSPGLPSNFQRGTY
jgi:hypothetical protein